MREPAPIVLGAGPRAAGPAPAAHETKRDQHQVVELPGFQAQGKGDNRAAKSGSATISNISEAPERTRPPCMFTICSKPDPRLGHPETPMTGPTSLSRCQQDRARHASTKPKLHQRAEARSPRARYSASSRSRTTASPSLSERPLNRPSSASRRNSATFTLCSLSRSSSSLKPSRTTSLALL
jgi:hypothetical protein